MDRNSNNNVYPRLPPHTPSCVHFLPSFQDPFTHHSKFPPSPLLATPVPYPSPPLTGSALAHTVSLPQVLDHTSSSALEDSLCPSDMQQHQSLPHAPISPPSTFPASTLALPLESHDNVAFLPSPVSSSQASPDIHHHPLLPDPPEGSDTLALQLPSPWTPANWLIVGPSPLTMSTDQHDLSWEDDRCTPQPLCAEPIHSVWSPESPPRTHELEMDSEPLSSSPSSLSSSWSSNPFSDNWDDDWTNQSPLGWARGSNQVDDYCMHSDCLAPFLTSFDSSSCMQYSPPGPDALRNYLDYHPMDTIDDDSSSSLSEDEQELLRSPVSSLRRCASLPGWDDEYLGDAFLVPQTPSRRTLLHDLSADGGEPARFPGILTLPGAENDELSDLNLVSPLPEPDIDLFPNENMFYGLGLSLSPSISIGSPSPELTNSRDLLSDFPELAGYPYEIPNDLSVPSSHPAYDVVKLLRLCRKSKQAERDARRQETQLGERVANISASLLPPSKMDAIPRKNMLRELHIAVEISSDARKIRKREKERWKEVRSWLRLKLEDFAKERANPGQIIEDAQTSADGMAGSASVNEVEDLGKKWMMNDMDQLVAKMMFRRKDVSRLLANRQTAKDYVRSPLAASFHTATDDSGEDVEDSHVDRTLDEMQGIISYKPSPLEDIEMPLMIN